MTRVFKIGSTKIADDDTTANLTNEQVRAHLKQLYPEVAEATIKEKAVDGITYVEFLPRPGRKG